MSKKSLALPTLVSAPPPPPPPPPPRPSALAVFSEAIRGDATPNAPEPLARPTPPHSAQFDPWSRRSRSSGATVDPVVRTTAALESLRDYDPVVRAPPSPTPHTNPDFCVPSLPCVRPFVPLTPVTTVPSLWRRAAGGGARGGIDVQIPDEVMIYLLQKAGCNCTDVRL